MKPYLIPALAMALTLPACNRNPVSPQTQIVESKPLTPEEEKARKAEAKAWAEQLDATSHHNLKMYDTVFPGIQAADGIDGNKDGLVTEEVARDHARLLFDVDKDGTYNGVELNAFEAGITQFDKIAKKEYGGRYIDSGYDINSGYRRYEYESNIPSRVTHTLEAYQAALLAARQEYAEREGERVNTSLKAHATNQK